MALQLIQRRTIHLLTATIMAALVLLSVGEIKAQRHVLRHDARVSKAECAKICRAEAGKTCRMACYFLSGPLDHPWEIFLEEQ